MQWLWSSDSWAPVVLEQRFCSPGIFAQWLRNTDSAPPVASEAFCGPSGSGGTILRPQWLRSSGDDSAAPAGAAILRPQWLSSDSETPVAPGQPQWLRRTQNLVQAGSEFAPGSPESAPGSSLLRPQCPSGSGGRRIRSPGSPESAPGSPKSAASSSEAAPGAPSGSDLGFLDFCGSAVPPLAPKPQTP